MTISSSTGMLSDPSPLPPYTSKNNHALTSPSNPHHSNVNTVSATLGNCNASSEHVGGGGDHEHSSHHHHPNTTTTHLTSSNGNGGNQYQEEYMGER